MIAAYEDPGTHDALVAAGGACAALWRSWHGERPVTSQGRSYTEREPPDNERFPAKVLTRS
ncbi:hypothetical protein ACF07S_20970 [Streptomyces sp. NPDC016640]|uniref:hypothetical protein n=1 Tax=Streptomyces sp. NPDC016640 TaxID=3364969 RepID=UPI0036F56AAB